MAFFHFTHKLIMHLHRIIQLRAENRVEQMTAGTCGKGGQPVTEESCVQILIMDVLQAVTLQT